MEDRQRKASQQLRPCRGTRIGRSRPQARREPALAACMSGPCHFPHAQPGPGPDHAPLRISSGSRQGASPASTRSQRAGTFPPAGRIRNGSRQPASGNVPAICQPRTSPHSCTIRRGNCEQCEQPDRIATRAGLLESGGPASGAPLLRCVSDREISAQAGSQGHPPFAIRWRSTR